MKYRALLGLILVYLAIFFRLDWIWGIIFLMWVIPDLRLGETHFMEVVKRKENPITYWAIVVSWIWMSIFMMATLVFPLLRSSGMVAVQPVHFAGEYTDKVTAPSVKAITVMNRQKIKNQPPPSTTMINRGSEKDTLDYKTWMQKDTVFFVGVSTQLNSYDEQLSSHMDELWSYFMNNDIMSVIPNIIDERVYCIYSDNDKDGNFNVTLGFQTSDINEVYEGLKAHKIAPRPFVVVESGSENVDDFVATTWEKIYNSSIDYSNDYNMEVYQFDEKYNLLKVEIRLSGK